MATRIEGNQCAALDSATETIEHGAFGSRLGMHRPRMSGRGNMPERAVGGTITDEASILG